MFERWLIRSWLSRSCQAGYSAQRDRYFYPFNSITVSRSVCVTFLVHSVESADIFTNTRHVWSGVRWQFRFSFLFAVRNFIVQISIWENGDINIDQFANELKTFFNYALLDVFMEFHVLNTPICDIPTRLHCSHHSSRRDSVMHRRPSINLGRSGGQSSASSSATTPKFGKTSVSHTTSASSTGKRHFSEPGTPVRSDSPAVITTGREELKLITEVVGSFPKDYSGSPHEASPSDMNRPVKRTSSTDSKRDSPHLTSSGKRDSPAMRREGSFTKKESPVLQRKLSGR